MHFPYTENFLDLETGEVVFVNDMTARSREKEEIYDQLDEHGFLRLPTSFDIQEYDIMEEFITTLPSPVREKLSEAIIGKGAFRRFKDGINRYDVERECYANAKKETVLLNMKMHDPSSPFLIGNAQPGDVIHQAKQKSWIDPQMRFDI